MSKHYYIYAYSRSYDANKYYDCAIEGDWSPEQLFDIGHRMARQVIEMNGLDRELYTEMDYCEDYDVNIIDDEYYDLLDEAIEDDCCCEVYPIRSDIILSDAENALHFLSPRSFIRKFCDEENEVCL